MSNDKNIIHINASAGAHFSRVLKEAKEVATEKNSVVQFEFNGVHCRVVENTDDDLLYRDYCNAYDLGWEVVGPQCVAEYDEETKTKLSVAKKIRDEENERSRIVAERRRAEQETSLEEAINGVELELSNEEVYNSYIESNTDPYGNAAVNYAIRWGRLMQVRMIEGQTLAECAEKASRDADTDGITGFMYGCAVGMLTRCWKHGEDLRKWHNGEYGHEGGGVVNPAVMTIG